MLCCPDHARVIFGHTRDIPALRIDAADITLVVAGYGVPLARDLDARLAELSARAGICRTEMRVDALHYLCPASGQPTQIDRAGMEQVAWCTGGTHIVGPEGGDLLVRGTDTLARLRAVLVPDTNCDPAQ